MALVCVDCVKENHLKQFIGLRGTQGVCIVCGETGFVSDTEENDFFQLIKTLVRYYYSEWDYNYHMGGDDYESLFSEEENIFFSKDKAVSDDRYDDLVQSIMDGKVYEDYDKGVSVFSGPGLEYTPLRSIKTDLDPNLIEISRRLEYENYFSVEKEVQSIINGYKLIAETFINKDTSFYRARVGFKNTKKHLSSGYEAANHYEPFSGDSLSAPPPTIVSGGRINRPGVSFLYCATDKNTAVAEVRPHPSDFVSIGMFRLIDNVRIFDLSDSRLIYFCKSDKNLESYKPLNTLGVLMNKAVPPSERKHYSITQLIADSIRQIGFDGISFSSAVGIGNNIVLFDSNVAKYTDNDSEVLEITEVSYHYKIAPLMDENGFYI